ncbi:cytochrome P450 [Rhizodiscina lignyota]|uniref:Cytochrome P450 n=1 Tax=Rhizodiscina lignyota TaxID=1504668 RepID=A0A9P4M0R2_9PEZI|nr:cytochrome P450 [Rhizodiscina lignyota]
MDSPTALFLFSPAIVYGTHHFYPNYTILATGFCASLIAVNFIFRVFVYPFVFSPFRHLPEPQGGSFPWAHADFIRKQNNGEPFRTWINSVPNAGIIRYRVFLNQERLLLTSPEALKEILVTKNYDFIKPAQPAFIFRKILGNGVLVAEGDEHKRQRKGLMPAFSFRHVKDLYPVFWAKGRQSTDMIVAASQSNRTQSAYEWASRATLDIIGLAGMGHDFDSLADPNTEINKTYKRLFAGEPPYFFWGNIGVNAPFQILFSLPLPLMKLLRQSAETVKSIGFEMIRRKHLLVEKGQHGEVDILSVAMDSGQFSDEDLANQLMTFLAAGHETTASAMTWATYLLCKHPDIQARLRAEVRAQLPSIRDAESSVTAIQVDHVSYLNAVCNEVLRLIPSVPMTRRDAVRDTELVGQHIPKGTNITIPPWAINTSFELWGEDALEFKPERWLGEGKANSGGSNSNYAFLTFLHGPRSCIGKDFAKSEFMCLLAAWIGRFEVQFADPNTQKDIIGWVTVRPKHGLPVIFKEVDGW